MNIILVLVVALLVAERNVEADFSYNRVLPKNEDLKTLGLKCIPGRTVIRVEEKKVIPTSDSEEDDDEEDTRRTHMNADNEFETCQVCVCSVEGKDEYCSRRPARNVNECIRMSMIKDEFERHLPFSHERSLAFRIRRVGSDLADSKCIPYVSEYSDCSAANVCTGCKRCSCDAEGNWACRRVIECPQVDENEAVDDLMLENALNNLYSGMEIKKTKRIPGALVPEPAKPEDDLLLGYIVKVSGKKHNAQIYKI